MDAKNSVVAQTRLDLLESMFLNTEKQKHFRMRNSWILDQGSIIPHRIILMLMSRDKTMHSVLCDTRLHVGLF